VSVVKCEFINVFPEGNQFMRMEIGTLEQPAFCGSRSNVRPAPSVRLPVTAANRALLRRLRAAESSAWEAGHILHCRWSSNNFAIQANESSTANNQSFNS
jgi:hypothetical protein